jgi:hypothetical protein
MTDQDGWGPWADWEPDASRWPQPGTSPWPQPDTSPWPQPGAPPQPGYRAYAAPTWQSDEAQTQVFRSSRHLAKSRRKPRRTRLALLAIGGSALALAAIATVLHALLLRRRQ